MFHKKLTEGSSIFEKLAEEPKTYTRHSFSDKENKLYYNGVNIGLNFTPNYKQAEETKIAVICTCKHSKNPPYCDGSHNSIN